MPKHTLTRLTDEIVRLRLWHRFSGPLRVGTQWSPKAKTPGNDVEKLKEKKTYIMYGNGRNFITMM